MSGPIGLNGELPEFHIISEGIQGLPGARGLPGPPGSDKLLSATGSIGAHRLLVKDGSGSIAYADAGILSHANRLLGMSANAALAGEQFLLVTADEITDPAWNWDMSKPIWLGSDGVPTQAIPAMPASTFSVIVGFPTSPSSMFVKLGAPVLLTR